MRNLTIRPAPECIGPVIGVALPVSATSNEMYVIGDFGRTGIAQRTATQVADERERDDRAEVAQSNAEWLDEARDRLCGLGWSFDPSGPAVLTVTWPAGQRWPSIDPALLAELLVEVERRRVHSALGINTLDIERIKGRMGACSA